MGASSNTISGTRSVEKLAVFRTILLLKIMQDHPKRSWISRLNYDKTQSEGFFFAGMSLPTGQVQFQIPENYWDLATQTFAVVLPTAHRPDDTSVDETIRRLTNWVSYQRKSSNKGIKNFTDFMATPPTQQTTR